MVCLCRLLGSTWPCLQSDLVLACFSFFVVDGWQHFSVICFFAALSLCCRPGIALFLSFLWDMLRSQVTLGYPSCRQRCVGAGGDPCALEQSDSQQPSSRVACRVKDSTQHRVPKVLSAVWRFSVQKRESNECKCSIRHASTLISLQFSL